MANISLTLYTNGFIGSVLMSPIQMGSLRVNKSLTNISRLGTFKCYLPDESAAICHNFLVVSLALCTNVQAFVKVLLLNPITYTQDV
jgi:hypothetical protein